jgi:hypothetical protein
MFIADIGCTNIIQEVSCVQLFSLISIADIAWMKSHPESESYVACPSYFYC